MDLGLFLSLVGAIAGSVAAITGVLVLMTLQPPFIQNASVRTWKGSVFDPFRF